MKKSIALFCIGFLLILTGCIPLAVNPFYTESSLIFDPDLVGSWGEESTGGLTINRDTDKGYLVIDHAEGNDAEFQGHLFKIDETLLIDFFPEETEGDINPDWLAHLIPAHTLFKVELEPDQLTLRPFNHDWLKEILTSAPDLIDHFESREMIVLSASSEEIVEFLKMNLDDPEMFGDTMVLKRIE